MSAVWIDGKKIAGEIESELKTKISKMRGKPRLSVIQVGDDPASTSYIKAKSNAAQRVGIELIHHHLSTTEHTLHVVRCSKRNENGNLPRELRLLLQPVRPPQTRHDRWRNLLHQERKSHERN